MGKEEKALQEEQMDKVRQIAASMLGRGKGEVLAYEKTRKIAGSQAISMMADIATEIYIQCLGDLAFIAKGREKKIIESMKENHKITSRKARNNFHYKCSERDKVLRGCILERVKND
jgi:hypothetical protein